MRIITLLQLIIIPIQANKCNNKNKNKKKLSRTQTPFLIIILNEFFSLNQYKKTQKNRLMNVET